MALTIEYLIIQLINGKLLSSPTLIWKVCNYSHCKHVLVLVAFWLVSVFVHAVFHYFLPSVIAFNACTFPPVLADETPKSILHLFTYALTLWRAEHLKWVLYAPTTLRCSPGFSTWPILAFPFHQITLPNYHLPELYPIIPMQMIILFSPSDNKLSSGIKIFLPAYLNLLKTESLITLAKEPTLPRPCYFNRQQNDLTLAPTQEW